MGLRSGDTKERALMDVALVLEAAGVPYAVIGGIAVQVWTREPRTTDDIDIALRSYSELPRAILEEAGFLHEKKFEHSDNWRAPGKGPRRSRTVVQFSVDTKTPDAVDRAETYEISGGPFLRVVGVADLIDLKLEAATEPRRRPTKRESDILDVKRLIEEHPEAKGAVPDLGRRLQAARALVLVDDERALKK